MGIEFFIGGWGLGFAIYVVLQLVTVVSIKRNWRVIAMLPVPIMIGVLLWTIYAYRSGSNLWPIVMIFASPLAILGVLVIWIAMWIAQKRDGAS